ncbi:hypothetical protein [Nocardiopsis kunsanensis]|uniref:hypothetical protein n=1 Tax=Nocardiopsis kunsanensis TaxID=141693 RepID=UPI001269629D|nr:hypothetical protein [Nocardiopsis kunsanensis]
MAADSAYGRDRKFHAFLEARRMPYVDEVPVKQTVTGLDGRRRVDTLIDRAREEVWHCVVVGADVRRFHDGVLKSSRWKRPSGISDSRDVSPADATKASSSRMPPVRMAEMVTGQTVRHA